MSIEFPLVRRQTPLGPISDPTILVAVRTPTGYRNYRFLIDTGADCSVVPRRLSQQIGLDWEALPAVDAIGVGRAGVRARFGRLPIRLENSELTVRCLFVDGPSIPFLLGRADFLDHFVLTIDQRQQKIILTEIP